jgi:hypothetical protein
VQIARRGDPFVGAFVVLESKLGDVGQLMASLTGIG